MELHPETKKRMEAQPLPLQDFVIELQGNFPKKAKVTVWTYLKQKRGEMQIHVIQPPDKRIECDKEIKKALEACPQIEREGDIFRIRKKEPKKRANKTNAKQ